jgi:hypothetical protein
MWKRPHYFIEAFPRAQQRTKKSVPQFSSRSLHPGAFSSSKLSHIAAGSMKLQPVIASKPANKLLIRLRLRATQPVIEVNNRENNAKLLTQLKQQPQ